MLRVLVLSFFLCTSTVGWAHAQSTVPAPAPDPATETAPARPPQANTPAAPQSVLPMTTAEDGSSETFYAQFTPDGTNEDGTTRVTGWDAGFGVALQDGRAAPATPAGPMGLAKALTTARPTTLMAQSIMYFGAATAPNNSNCMGFNNAASGSTSNAPAQRFAVCLGSNSAYLLNGGTVTPLNAPDAANFVSVTMWHTADGTLSTSMVQMGTNGAVTNTLTGITPPPDLTNFEISGGSANDRQYGSRYAVSSGNAPERINMAFDGGVHPGGAAVLTSNTAGGVFALIPPDYRPAAANRAVLYMHGLGEIGWSVSCQAPYAGCNPGVTKVALALMNAGYVVIGLNDTDRGCYGNATCVSELRTVLEEFEAKLAIGGGLYGFGDSMGGFQLLNAIAQGVFAPRAIAGCCLNTNLADDYFVDYKAPGSKHAALQAGSAKPLIDRAYGISPDHPYAEATDGYDPMLAADESLTRLVQVPAMFWASRSDQAVNRTYNAEQYATKIKGAGGEVTVIPCTGLHEDLSCFDPAAVVDFFHQH